jgi:hypothetical protein
MNRKISVRKLPYQSQRCTSRGGLGFRHHPFCPWSGKWAVNIRVLLVYCWTRLGLFCENIEGIWMKLWTIFWVNRLVSPIRKSDTPVLRERKFRRYIGNDGVDFWDGLDQKLRPAESADRSGGNSDAYMNIRHYTQWNEFPPRWPLIFWVRWFFPEMM